MSIKFIAVLIIFLSLLFSAYAENSVHSNQSYAQEYSHLRKLLQQVNNRESAIAYKSQIEQELNKLKSSQISGQQQFSALSKSEQSQFIKKFQNNHLHCGEVTQVMEERRRILLDPELSQVLSPLMNKIP